MSKPDVHVVHKNDKWAVQKEGSQRALRTFDTQKDALGMAKEIARKECVELFVHGRDGQIRDRMSYGNDPRDIPG